MYDPDRPKRLTFFAVSILVISIGVGMLVDLISKQDHSGVIVGIGVIVVGVFLAVMLAIEIVCHGDLERRDRETMSIFRALDRQN